MGAISYRHRTNGPEYEVYMTNGGIVPKELDGYFVSKGEVTKAINIYLSKKEDKIKKQTPTRKNANNKSS